MVRFESNEVLSVRVKREDIEALRRIAATYGRSVAEHVRELVRVQRMRAEGRAPSVKAT
jgi:hypothetical protein